MRHRVYLGWIGLGVIGMLACNAPGAATATPTSSVTPTNLPLPTTAPTVGEPTNTPATISPTLPSPTVTPTPVIPTSAGVDRVKIYLVAREDGGKSGDLIGCGDSIVAVEQQITPTQAPLQAALERLLSLTGQFYGESGLYNALYQSTLTVKDITIDSEGRALVYLEGTLLSGGVCDDPRIIEQLTYTARQFSTVKSAAIYINGTPIEELLSGK